MCCVHGTTLFDETAYDVIKRQHAFANASPLLPFRDSISILFRRGVQGNRRDGYKRGGTSESRRVSGENGVIEIVGGNSSGKTTCCLHAACICVMPCALGGYESGVLMIDCDGKFDLFRFVQMLEHKIVSMMDSSFNNSDQQIDDNNELQHVFRESLSRMFVVKCWNTLQLLATTFFMNATFEQMIVRLFGDQFFCF